MGSRIEIYREEFEEGLHLSYEHAQALLESADLLKEQGKESAAIFLSIHAREELGRGLLILDDIESGKPGISEKRWEDKLKKHKHKLRRAQRAAIEEIGYKTTDVVGINPQGKDPQIHWKTDGETSEEMASYDMEERDSSLYVDHRLVGGHRTWVSPLHPVGLDSAENSIEYTKLISDVLKKKAQAKGIIL